jgi:hypothetical protein
VGVLAIILTNAGNLVVNSEKTVNIRQTILISFIQWIPLALLIVMVSGLVYAVVQQNYRSNANDPQIQMATDARVALTQGASPQSLVPSNHIDIAQSLAPYLIIYDSNGKPAASSATLNGQTPTPPSGVFADARTMDMDTLTWEPATGVRSAIVVVHYAGGYVLAGRSLNIIEERESNLELISGAFAIVALVVTYLSVFFTQLAMNFLIHNRTSSTDTLQPPI